MNMANVFKKTSTRLDGEKAAASCCVFGKICLARLLFSCFPIRKRGDEEEEEEQHVSRAAGST